MSWLRLVSMMRLSMLGYRRLLYLQQLLNAVSLPLLGLRWMFLMLQVELTGETVLQGTWQPSWRWMSR